MIDTGADGKLSEPVQEAFHNAWRKVCEVLAAKGAAFADLV